MDSQKRKLAKNNNTQPDKKISGINFTLRLIWFILTIVTLGLFVYGLFLSINEAPDLVSQRALGDLGFTNVEFVTFNFVVNLVVLLAHILISAVIQWRRQHEWIAQFVAISLVASGSILPLSSIYQPGIAPPGAIFLANLVVITSLISSTALLFIFPNGRFAPSWSKIVLVVWAALALFAVLFTSSSLSITTWALPIQILIVLLSSGAGIYAQKYRYEKVSTPQQRQQTKWALIGLAAAVIGPVVWLFGANLAASGPESSNLLYQRMGAAFFTSLLLYRLVLLTFFRLATVLFPLSFAIAILRYRLWDIDVLIRRTLIYGALTVTLLLIYLFTVLIMEALFTLIFGQQSTIAVVISTLIIAALFNPMRNRVQESIDRQFYRQKYDAERTLQHFSENLRNEVDLDQLSSRIFKVVDETMQPSFITLWIKEE